MTTKPNPVIEALEEIAKSPPRENLPSALDNPRMVDEFWKPRLLSRQALTLAQELVEKAEALEWILHEFCDKADIALLKVRKDCPVGIKKMLEKGNE